MISPEQFIDYLQSKGIQFFAGVPDSLLKPICTTIENSIPKHRHIIAANEGGAIALGMGHHLATGQTPVIYLQNSGLGNVINPLLSLADNAIYGIPMIILMGWRGEPGVKDEPQHVKQGQVMCEMLQAMDIPSLHLSPELTEARAQLDEALAISKQKSCPYVINISKNTFSASQSQTAYPAPFAIEREQAIETIVQVLNQANALWVATTGMISRELYEIREKCGQDHQQDFLTVGGMGHASSIALGLANERPHQPVICLDGDGAALMHMGALAIIGQQQPQQFYHILLNNGAHDSVGGQPTVALDMDWVSITKAVGYTFACSVSDTHQLQQSLRNSQNVMGPKFIEVRVNRGHRKDLGRPTHTPQAAKDMFMTYAVSKI